MLAVVLSLAGCATRRLGSGKSLVGQLVTRNAERETPKRLYMVGAAVSQLLSADEREALKVTSVGVKAFERQESKVSDVPACYSANSSSFCPPCDCKSGLCCSY